MLKLHANMHGYRPDRALDWLRPAMKMCAKYNVVVLIHTGDGPYTIPTMFYPIIREFPMVNFIIGHFGIQTGGNYSFEAFWMAMDTPNVYCESAGASSRASSSSPSSCRRKRSSSAPTRRRTSPACGCASSRCCARSRRRAWASTRTASRTTWATTSRAWSASSPTPPPKDLDEAEGALKDTYGRVHGDRPTARCVLRQAAESTYHTRRPPTARTSSPFSRTTARAS